MAKIKNLKEKNIVFYPQTIGSAVVFEDGTNTEVTENQMNQIFN